jgi:hypothetical protein
MFHWLALLSVKIHSTLQTDTLRNERKHVHACTAGNPAFGRSATSQHPAQLSATTCSAHPLHATHLQQHSPTTPYAVPHHPVCSSHLSRAYLMATESVQYPATSPTCSWFYKARHLHVTVSQGCVGPCLTDLLCGFAG